jgi:hypothetical protein
MLSNRARWLWVTVFATAMGWMEAATVFYLRAKIDRLVPYQPNPLPTVAPVGVLSWGEVELWREVATLVMLLAAGWLAGLLGLTYEEINVYIFVVIWPIVTMMLIGIILWQHFRLRQPQRNH